jgi:hypothetical protein
MLKFVFFATGNRIFSFEADNVDMYLPQLLIMYIYMHDVAEALHPYLVYRYLSGMFCSLCGDVGKTP